MQEIYWSLMRSKPERDEITFQRVKMKCPLHPNKPDQQHRESQPKEGENERSKSYSNRNNEAEKQIVNKAS